MSSTLELAIEYVPKKNAFYDRASQRYVKLKTLNVYINKINQVEKKIQKLCSIKNKNTIKYLEFFTNSDSNTIDIIIEDHSYFEKKEKYEITIEMANDFH